MSAKYLAYIFPNEDFYGKTTCTCTVRFISGDLKDKSITAELFTDIFRYSYYGVTFEVVDYDKSSGRITSVQDVRGEDVKAFGLGVCHIVTYDITSHRAVCSDGVVYDLSHNVFYNRCKNACETIIKTIENADNFAAFLYISKDGVLYISMYVNLRPDEKQYKYAVHKGFITKDEKLLKNLNTTVSIKVSDEKMDQTEVDKLLKDMGL